MDQIRPRVIKASHFLPLSTLYIHESYQLDFTDVITTLDNLEDKDKDDPGSRIPGSAASSQTIVESEWQDSAMYEAEAEADLDLLAHDLDPEFGDSLGSEILGDRVTEPDILVF